MNTNALPHRHRLVFAGLAGLIAAAILLCPGPGHAQPSPDDKSELGVVYRKGKTAYDLGNFDEAIKYFKQAYAMQPHEAHLYNIAQAYRQAGDCRNALFFYKRYVAVGGTEARHYEVVQRRIKELTSSCKVIDDMKNKPPLESLEPGKGENAGGEQPGTGTSGTGGAGAIGTGGTVTSPAPVDNGPSDPVLAASLELGGAVLQIGHLDIEGAHFSLGVGAGYPLTFDKLGITLGGLFTYTPVPWTNERTATSGTSALIGVLANVGARYAVSEQIAVRFELGMGALILSGLSQGSVFLPDDTMATGALGMLNVRAGIGAEYLLTDNLVFSVSPLVFSYSPAKEGLREEVESFVRFDFIAGLGYRL
ncbi:MAG TPA: tetratricopeptide repeat protein [Haliangium sp.]|nr:tetratricopeptide repeat protein [Haliangium sp.]